MPEDCASELIDEVGAPLQALLIDARGTDSAAALQLSEARVAFVAGRLSAARSS